LITIYLINSLILPPEPPDRDLVILSALMLLSLGSLALFENFCNNPGRAVEIAPVTIGGRPNLLARLLTSPPSIALDTGLPDDPPP